MFMQAVKLFAVLQAAYPCKRRIKKETMTLDEILADANATLSAVASLPELEQTKAKYLGKTGSLTEQLKSLGKLPPEEKKEAGAAINAVKGQVEALINAAKARLKKNQLAVGIGVRLVRNVDIIKTDNPVSSVSNLCKADHVRHIFNLTLRDNL